MTPLPKNISVPKVSTMSSFYVALTALTSSLFLIAAPIFAAEVGQSKVTTSPNSKPFIRSLLPDNSLLEYCRDVRINTIVVPSFCSLIVQARRNYLKGDYQGAVNLYTQVVNLEPSYGQGFYNRGLAYLALSNRSAARNDFLKAAALFQQQGDTVNQQKALEMINT